MGLLDLLLWPVRTSTAIFVSILSVCVHVILSPFKLLQRLIKFFLDKFHQTITWTESKINYIKASKPLSYFVSSPDNDVDLSLIPTTVPVLGLNEGHDKRSLAISRSTVRRRPPSTTRPTIVQSKCDKDQDTQMAINALIQELIDLSEYQPISSTHHKEEVDHSLPLPHTTKSDTNDEREKALQLIRELQELATSERGSKQQTQLTTSDDGEEDGVSNILADLNVLETYLSQFVHEQEQDEMNSNYGRVSSLETITEEETSKESSPTFPSSPIPSRVCPTSYSSSEDVIEEKEVVTEADVDQALRLLQRVTGSEELQRMFKQIQDSRSGSGDIETELVSPTRARASSLSSPEIINKQFTETDREFQSVINSLEQQHKFIETQQELQNMINSMNPDNITSPTKTPPNSESPKVPEDQQIYDSLDPSPPIYSVPKKKSSLPPPLFDEDKIYDSISANNQTNNMITPPPVPLRRTESDGGMSISSADLSPKCERRRHSLDSEEDGSQRYEGERHKSRRHKRPSSRHRHHCCHCDDHSPDRCSHHRPRSRERHSHHRHHRPRSGSDESRSSRHRRVPESSGYESQELDSPSIPRRVGTPNSDVSSPSAPNTPKDGRRRFFGLFTKKSTSLTSLSSRTEHQDTSDRGSVSSYKM